jgi:dolichol-phosphate mannosyltransferase
LFIEQNPKNIEISIVAPVFNESESISRFCESVRGVMDSMSLTYEVIFIDDGSTDGSFYELSNIKWPEMRILRFLKNSGHQSALDAGYRESTGEYVVTLDSDMQHPPELIPKLYGVAISQKVDVVYASRPDRGNEGVFKKRSAVIFYWMISKLTDLQIQPNAADFRLISKRVVQTLNLLPPGGQVFRLLIPSLGFQSATVEYKASPRFAGKSKYGLARMANLGVDSILQFSVKPLQLAIRFGLAVSFLSLAGFAYVLITFALDGSVQGWSSLISALLLLFGALFIFLGIFGSYLSILVKQAQARPPYLFREDGS